MKSQKVTYITETGRVHKTFVPADANVEGYMYLHYSNVTVLDIKPSVKECYKHFCNKFISQLAVI